MVRASLDLLSYCWKTFIKNFDCTVAAVFCRRARRLNWSAVALVNLANGLRYSATSNGYGSFVLELLPPGDYPARAEAPGMSRQSGSAIHVEVGGTTILNFQLSVSGTQGDGHGFRSTATGGDPTFRHVGSD